MCEELRKAAQAALATIAAFRERETGQNIGSKEAFLALAQATEDTLLAALSKPSHALETDRAESRPDWSAA